VAGGRRMYKKWAQMPALREEMILKANRTLLAIAAAAVMAGVGATHSVAADKYTIYLSNNFVGNDWRQQMIRVAELAVTKPPLAGRVDLKVENVENTVQAQLNSLNNIIRAKPNAILITGQYRNAYVNLKSIYGMSLQGKWTEMHAGRPDPKKLDEELGLRRLGMTL